ncbi:hypothetical protein MARI151_50241 [Maribacter litoralis]|uniref:Uncharacterized protein n=1 Tax=Maribacter litoralis TaxID=2059726 RepID=A0A653US35_9FLAO|nr:hypothetical protein MARI151_50241 [Maribacter litoralis]
MVLSKIGKNNRLLIVIAAVAQQYNIKTYFFNFVKIITIWLQMI